MVGLHLRAESARNSVCAMRIILVWVVGILLISTIAMVWYLTQPMLIMMVQGSSNLLTGLGHNSTRGTQTFTLLEYFVNLWPIPFVLSIGLWMFISSGKEDAESRVYG